MLTLSSRARRDLAENYNRIADQSVRSAERWLRGVDLKLDVLSDFPELGRARPELDADARSLPFQNWLIIDRLVDGDVLVVRVVDGRRDLPRLRFGPA